MSLMNYLQVMGHQQFIVHPSSLDGTEQEDDTAATTTTTTTTTNNVADETPFSHVSGLTEQILRQQGIPLNQAIQEVKLFFNVNVK